MSAMKRAPGAGRDEYKGKPGKDSGRGRAGKAKPFVRATNDTPYGFKPRAKGDEPRTDSDRSFKPRKPYERKDGDTDNKGPYSASRSEKPTRPYHRKDEGEPRSSKFSSERPSGDSPAHERKPYGKGNEGARPYRGKNSDNGRTDKAKPYTKSTNDTPYGFKPRDKDDESRPYGDRSFKPRKPYERKDDDTDNKRPYAGSRSEKPSRPWQRKDEDEPRSSKFSSEKPSDDRPAREHKPYGKGNEGSRPYRGKDSDRPSTPWKPRGESHDREYKKKDDDRPSRKFEDKEYKPRRRFDDKPDTDKPAGRFRKTEDSYPSRKPGSSYRDKKPSDIKPKANKGFGDDGTIRLNKYIANSGVCSRREADALIIAGAVSINGKIVTQLGTRITRADKVDFGGETLSIEKKVYLILNKPKGYITTVDDPQERNTVMMLVKDACRERIYPVGRLDRNTSGLLLFTNDGELAKKLTHPSHKIRKVYHVELDHGLSKADMQQLTDGLELEDGKMSFDEIAYTGKGDDRKNIGVVIHSGRNRVVRRMFEALEYEVVKLDRVALGGLTKKDLPRGRWRFLEQSEINMMMMI